MLAELCELISKSKSNDTFQQNIESSPTIGTRTHLHTTASIWRSSRPALRRASSAALAPSATYPGLRQKRWSDVRPRMSETHGKMIQQFACGAGTCWALAG